MRAAKLGLVGIGIAASVAVACAASEDSEFGDDESAAQGGASTGGSDTTGGGDDSSGIGGGLSGSGSGGGNSTPCMDGDPDTDNDGDGWTENEGDCNDCDENVNPGAIEVATPMGGSGGSGGGTGGAPPEPADEDCDGTVDNVPMPCDSGLVIDSNDAMDGARAMELCKEATGPKDYGVISAKWTLPNGDAAPPNDPNYDLGHGILDAFGANVSVQAGAKMLVLSSGTARQPSDPDYQDVSGFSKGIYSTGHPMGFPKESPSCGSTVTGDCNDGVALEVELRVPTNGTGFKFDFDFYTYEWPTYVCSQFNDFFAAILSPIPMGQSDGNITFDSMGNPISVNNAFFEVCGCSNGPPCQAGGLTFSCSLGTAELQGTGFEGHAATSWLQTQAPAEGGTEITLRFTTYDSGDGILDSTALVDSFEWLAEPGVTVGTDPVPDPE